MDSVYLLRAPVAREYQMWLQSGLSGNHPSSIHIGAGMPPPLRRIQVEELPAPVEVSLGVAESLALAHLPASPASISTCTLDVVLLGDGEFFTFENLTNFV